MSRYVDIAPYDDCKIVLHKEDEGIRCRDLITVDVVEVVHCKNCVYFSDNICMCGEKRTSYGSEFYPYANDFCSYGRRKGAPDNVEQSHIFNRFMRQE